MPGSVRLSSDALVGRDEELTDAAAVLRDVPEGRPGVVVVSGPAGIGKTRFAAALADELRADQVRVLTGSCLDMGAGAPPYSALIAAFRSVDPPAGQLLEALTGAVEMRRSRLFELLRSTVIALARRHPTILVVEDLHWSDRVTRDALLYLSAMAREGRWGLVLTFREDEVAARPAVHDLLDALRRDTLAHLSLDALAPMEVATQMASITGAEPARPDVERVYRRSGGIPLLVEEVLAADAAGLSGVPAHLRDWYLARVRRLGARTARAVEVVAVRGEGCGERLVAATLGIERAGAAAALDRAVAADVLVPHGQRYRMRHELLRDAVYDALPPARRRRLHSRIATVLATALQPDVAALAHHWYEADEPTQAALANLEAAALAERVHAPMELRTYLRRVLEHFDALPAERAHAVGGRAALLARAAEAAFLGGAFDQAVALAEASISQTLEPADLAVRWERLARYHWVNADGPGAQHAHERSLEHLLADASPSVRSQVVSGYAWYLSMAGRAADARPWSDRAVAAAGDSGIPVDRCRALLAWGLARPDDQAGLDVLWQARALAVQCDTGDELGRAHAALDVVLRQHGRTSEREPVLRDGYAYAAAHGMTGSYGRVMTYLLAGVLIDLGRWDEAHEMVAASVHDATGTPAMFAHAYRARLAAARGDESTLKAAVERVRALSEGLPQQPIPLATALCARAEWCLWSGEVTGAFEYAEQAVELTADPLCEAEARVLRVRALADQAERNGAYHDAGQDAEVGGHVDDEVPARHPRVKAFGATRAAESARGAGRREPEPWRAAVSAWDEEGDPYRAAYCRWRLAKAMLATRTGRSEAARELEIAREAAARLDARPLLHAIDELVSAAKLSLATARPPTGASTRAAELGLTYRELEILPMLVAGRTNAEIAQVLVISPRTVGVHVSRILHKLGAARRTEAADIARRRGLVPG
ncbi:MAG TPA: AAA family ATPase [Jiangellaceae bacterium]|nr:AAA family ATPase [Jiangellaceae bacterium]